MHCSHAPRRTVGATVPAVHCVGRMLPAVLKEPGLVGVQSAALVRTIEVEYDPCPHGIGADEPTSQKEPARHVLHSVAPVSLWYLPAAHGSHLPCRTVRPTVPAEHGVGSTEPIGAKKPGSVGVHSSALVRLVASEYEPSSHGRGADAPHLQYAPGSHGPHTVAPSVSWYVPCSHGSHLSRRSWSLYVPALQLVASALPTGQNVPFPHGSQSLALVIVTLSRLVVPPGHGSGAVEPTVQ
eukprot:1908530-Prymnesium_polylepis.2